MTPVLTKANFIAEGDYRRVYQHPTRPDMVVKAEKTTGTFCNVTEWLIWKANCNLELGRWLAKCYYISPCGTVLFQERLDIDGKHGWDDMDWPVYVPGVLNTLQKANWGLRLDNGAFACCDYGSTPVRLDCDFSRADWSRQEWADIVENSEEFNYGKI